MERGSSHLKGRMRRFSKENGEGRFLIAWGGPSPALEEGLGWICTAGWGDGAPSASLEQLRGLAGPPEGVQRKAVSL